MTPFPRGPFQVIYADPPWDYRGQVQHGGAGAGYTSGARAFYQTMTVDEICALPVREIADPKQSILFLWATGPILTDALAVLSAWGFKFKTVAFVWDKQRVNPGAYTLSQCEYVLAGTRGRIPQPRGARNVRQLVSEARTAHSAKPKEVRKRIDAMFPSARKLELFAREAPIDWHVWGNEVPEPLDRLYGARIASLSV